MFREKWKLKINCRLFIFIFKFNKNENWTQIFIFHFSTCRKNEWPQYTRIHNGSWSYTWKFQNFTCVFTTLVNFDIYFLGLPWEIFFGVITDDLLHLKSLKNVNKEFNIIYIIMVHGVCPLKIRITQFPGGFCLCETAAFRRPLSSFFFHSEFCH